MKLFQRIFFAAVLAGLAAGLAMAAVQQWRVAPLILAAELYETAAPAADHEHGAATHEHEGATPAHGHEEDAWAPQNGAERTAYTLLADLLAAMGYALLLAAVSVLSGLPLTARNGVVWGLGGFIAFQLAPAFGLPPELPGMPAADLGLRQLWWLATALATGAGLLLVARLRTLAAIAVAATLMVLPHLVGAPQFAGSPDSAVPAELATRFAASALSAAAVFWLSVGPLLGWLNERFAAARRAPARAAA